MDISELKKIVIAKEAEYEYLRSKRKEINNELKNKKQYLDLVLESQNILQQVALEVQSRLTISVNSIVNTAVNSVFDEEYFFNLDFVTKRQHTTVEYTLKKGDLITTNIPISTGGGILSVISFALRLACLLLSGKNKILILDENFSHVAKNKQEQIGNMLSVLAEKLGVQLILITHEDELNPPGNKCFEI
ncbi:MAG TPA: hypothetical protein PLI14_06440 [Bacilli bacterium]|jgi:ABC-type dipeptide/oligopeptide/nickel transport system ATPase subunit|nr:hypothetical protein [Bacilli bacterium]